jgi:hypothetical protein
MESSCVMVASVQREVLIQMYKHTRFVPMRMRPMIAVSLFSLCFMSCGIEFGVPSTPGSYFESYSSVDGKEIVFGINEEHLKDSPEWSPGKELPVALDKAVQIAREEIPNYSNDGGAWQLSGIELHRWYTTDKWFLVITFYGKGGGLLQGNNLRIPILFSGKAIKGHPKGAAAQ